jgi:hypothetical protein
VHPFFFAVIAFATALVVITLVVAAREIRSSRREPLLGSWMDLDGSARRRAERLTPSH